MACLAFLIFVLDADESPFRLLPAMRISGGGQAPEEIHGVRSCRDGGTRHNNRERFLVFEITLAMANDRVLRALSRWHRTRNRIAEMMVTACEPALVPDSQ